MITEFPVFHMARSRMALRIVATLAAAGLMAACGFKGPLYMPAPDGSKPQTQNRNQGTNPIPQTPQTPGAQPIPVPQPSATP